MAHWTTSTTTEDAYETGQADGYEWDLSGFDGRKQLAATIYGWDEATINAIGSARLAAIWGIEEDGDGWDTACARYNEGCLEGALEQWDEAESGLGDSSGSGYDL